MDRAASACADELHRFCLSSAPPATHRSGAGEKTRPPRRHLQSRPSLTSAAPLSPACSHHQSHPADVRTAGRDYGINQTKCQGSARQPPGLGWRRQPREVPVKLTVPPDGSATKAVTVPDSAAPQLPGRGLGTQWRTEPTSWARWLRTSRRYEAGRPRSTGYKISTLNALSSERGLVPTPLRATASRVRHRSGRPREVGCSVRRCIVDRSMSHMSGCPPIRPLHATPPGRPDRCMRDRLRALPGLRAVVAPRSHADPRGDLSRGDPGRHPIDHLRSRLDAHRSAARAIYLPAEATADPRLRLR